MYSCTIILRAELLFPERFFFFKFSVPFLRPVDSPLEGDDFNGWLDPLVKGMDQRIRIHTKMSWIRNTAFNNALPPDGYTMFITCQPVQYNRHCFFARELSNAGTAGSCWAARAPSTGTVMSTWTTSRTSAGSAPAPSGRPASGWVITELF